VRLNWFAPLPPARSGVAEYTAGLLPALSRRTRLVLWTDQPTWDAGLERFAEVRRYEPTRVSWHELNRADMTVYNIGNHPTFHGNIWEVSRQHGGIVILHDVCLQHFLAEVYRVHRRDREGYLAEVERWHGSPGRRAAEACWAGWLTTHHLADRYPLAGPAVENALAVVVHAAESAGQVGKLSPRLVVYAPLPYPASSGPARSARALGPPFRLIALGHLGPNRRLDSLLEALAAFEGRAHFRLDVYGEVAEAERLRQRIARLELDGLVRLQGFAPADRFDAALAAGHLAANLRYPTMGEASFTQLRIWDHALPAMVSRAGWYAGLPPDAVAFVRPHAEVGDIRAHLGAFLADPGRFAAMGARGRQLLEREHAPEAYVETLLALAERAREHGASAVTWTRARTVAAELGQRSGPEGAAPPLPPEIGVLDFRQSRALWAIRDAVDRQSATLQARRAALLDGFAPAPDVTDSTPAE
jgi:glycosyltransferase involved in cell wall biosynthesis